MSFGKGTKGSSKKARTARRNARLNRKRGTNRTGKLKISISAQRAAKHLANSKLAKAMGLSGFGNWAAKKIPKGWKVNHNLKTAIKSKIGEKNYKSSTSKSGGSGPLTYGDLTQQQLADYDFYNRWNPTGRTITQAKKAYHRQLKEGYSLKEAMQYNPAETGFYEALINDPENQIRGLYQSVLGREADDAGLDYWKDEFESGKSNIQSIKDSFMKSDEYLNKNPSTGSSTTASTTTANTTTTNNTQKKDLASIVAALNRGTYNT